MQDIWGKVLDWERFGRVGCGIQQRYDKPKGQTKEHAITFFFFSLVTYVRVNLLVGRHGKQSCERDKPNPPPSDDAIFIYLQL